MLLDKNAQRFARCRHLQPMNPRPLRRGGAYNQTLTVQEYSVVQIVAYYVFVKITNNIGNMQIQ
jgi:hypothetical protein